MSFKMISYFAIFEVNDFALNVSLLNKALFGGVYHRDASSQQHILMLLVRGGIVQFPL